MVKNLRNLSIAAAVLVMFGSAIAYASIPDANGIIHGCYKNNNGSLRVIDTALNETCNTSTEKALSWSSIQSWANDSVAHYANRVSYDSTNSIITLASIPEIGVFNTDPAECTVATGLSRIMYTNTTNAPILVYATSHNRTEVAPGSTLQLDTANMETKFITSQNTGFKHANVFYDEYNVGFGDDFTCEAIFEAEVYN